MQQEHKTYDLDEDNIPRDVKVYKEKEYWDFRFKNELKYDWIAEIEKLDQHSPGLIQELVNILIDKSVLNLGCGNSNLHNILSEKGVSQITNCDYSSILIENMQQKQPNFKWVEADITQLQKYFQAQSFDSIIEKCTLDALTVDVGDPWKPSEVSQQQMQSVFDGVYYCLKSRGYFISFSFEQPHFRKKFFQKLDNMFTIQLRRKIEIGFKECFVYFMQKI